MYLELATILLTIIGLMILTAVILWITVSPANPHKDHEGYTQIWSTLSPLARRRFKSNIGIVTLLYSQKIPVDLGTEYYTVHVRPMGRKFSLLTLSRAASYTARQVVTEKFTYFALPPAALECKKQGLQLMETEAEWKTLLFWMPGNTPAEKLRNLYTLLGLPSSFGHYISVNGGEPIKKEDNKVRATVVAVDTTSNEKGSTDKPIELKVTLVYEEYED